MSEARREALRLAMAGMAAGDRAALDTVYEMTSGKLFATIVRIVRMRERAEDLLQETYIKAWQRAGRFDPAKGSPITWLCTLARNTALSDLRRDGRLGEEASDELPEIADDARPQDDWLCDVEDAEALQRCLETLQDDHRRSIRLAFFDGLTHSELASKVDAPLGTIKSWIRRGLSGLKGCLGG
ncbi:sigma-70 family RNA polymerase sigma factor [Parerythrobacter aestuarii]|uniref:sigma-70 family RNA polymerase sigma factor n=1 Tax=Parerythrobacter aestuarii TaxID=3020909 RepID=UPI0024DE0067|nr:sigma-70 family RNA polymerase sigma factor [Parerythrobacter aestuarii]